MVENYKYLIFWNLFDSSSCCFYSTTLLFSYENTAYLALSRLTKIYARHHSTIGRYNVFVSKLTLDITDVQYINVSVNPNFNCTHDGRSYLNNDAFPSLTPQEELYEVGKDVPRLSPQIKPLLWCCRVHWNFESNV